MYQNPTSKHALMLSRHPWFLPTRSFAALVTCACLTFMLAACGDSGASSDSAAADASALECAEDNGGITLPDDLCAAVVADSVGGARHLTVADNGDVYVALRSTDSGGGIVALRDTDGDGTADMQERFGDTGGTGIDIHKGYLYFGSNQEVRRYQMNEGSLRPASEYEVIASGFPEQDQHAVKPFAFDGAGHMYVNVGGPSNACQEEMRTAGSPGLDPCPQLERQAGIWRFADDQPDQTQTDHGARYATGIRNAVALTWNDQDGTLYVAQHGRDQLHQLWPDLYTQEESAMLPAEEFFRVNEGDDFGWPYCYYDWQENQKELAPEYGGDGSEVGRCSDFEDPITAFPGHWAPNDVIFYQGDALPETYQGGALIAFHGSWNRAPLEQAGYKVAFVPFENGEVAGDYEVFADGFPGTDSLMAPSDAEYRPMGLALGPDGSLYISDSQKGRIWRVFRKPDAAS